MSTLSKGIREFFEKKGVQVTRTAFTANIEYMFNLAGDVERELQQVGMVIYTQGRSLDLDNLDFKIGDVEFLHCHAQYVNACGGGTLTWQSELTYRMKGFTI